MQVEIVTIGDELLLGFTIDTNAAHLARQLAAVGVEIVRRTTVGDAAHSIATGVRDALDRAGAVITTGGLGPTADDQTKPAIAALFGRAMRLDDEILEGLRRRWKDRGWGELPVSNEQQAMVPEGARILTNNHGSAPGIWLEDERGRWVAMLPGVPREMRGMLADTLLPLVRERAAASTGTVILSATLRTTGIAESKLADRLGDLARGIHGMPLAYLPGVDGVDLRLTARGLPAPDAQRALADGIAQLRALVGNHAYAEGDRDMADVVLAHCRDHRLHIAVAESCTGGLLGERLTAIPGSSDVFRGGIIAYENDVKHALLGVSEDDLRVHGAVSEPVVRQMAAGVRNRLGAEIGVGITGVAGPGGGTPDKPVGTVWIAVDTGHYQRAYGGRFFGDRAEIRYRATQSALEMIRQAPLR